METLEKQMPKQEERKVEEVVDTQARLESIEAAQESLEVDKKNASLDSEKKASSVFARIKEMFGGKMTYEKEVDQVDKFIKGLSKDYLSVGIGGPSTKGKSIDYAYVQGNPEAVDLLNKVVEIGQKVQPTEAKKHFSSTEEVKVALNERNKNLARLRSLLKTEIDKKYDKAA